MRHTVVSAIGLLAMLFAAQQHAAAQGIPTAPVEVQGNGGVYVADGYVEAIRQSVIAAQVPGRVTALTVKAGDRVKRGELLVRIDERAAAQQAAASEAQVAAARAQLDAARKEYERSERLFRKQYISQAAMDQAEAQFKASRARARAMLAQAGAASAQTSFHVLHAPYSGIAASVSTELGDMAVPGKPLITIYDPRALRVVASVPERYIHTLKEGAPIRLEIPSAPAAARWQAARSMTVLPTFDPASHTVQVRLDLAPDVPLAPGAFARAYLPTTAAAPGVLMIPVAAVVRHVELDAVYVATADGKFRLQQVRLGKVTDGRIAVFAGLQAGERVALNPLAAAARQ